MGRGKAVASVEVVFTAECPAVVNLHGRCRDRIHSSWYLWDCTVDCLDDDVFAVFTRLGACGTVQWIVWTMMFFAVFTRFVAT